MRPSENRTPMGSTQSLRTTSLGDLSDAAIGAMLNEQAAELGAALGQERIFVAFAEPSWVLDAGERRRLSPS